MAAVAIAVPLPSAPAQPAGFDLVAHRGGPGEAATEGSLQAFGNALEVGVSTLEFDIVITKDHQPVVWHDQTIESQKCADTGPVFAGDPQYPYVGKQVHNLTLSQVRTLDCGNQVVTLPEVFALADRYRADVRYDIETKVNAEEPSTSGSPQEFVDVIMAAVRSAGLLERVEIQSFDWATLLLVRQAQPSIPVVALWNETTWRPDSPWLAGINPAVVGDPITAAMMVGANILSPAHTLADNALIDRAHALGLKVIPWTINDADTMRAQIAAGADGIITDRPAILRAVLAELGMPLPPAYHR
ncbi:MAG: glycerophosphodiester phosphodiesterase family protein [Mycobacterium sp.]